MNLFYFHSTLYNNIPMLQYSVIIHIRMFDFGGRIHAPKLMQNMCQHCVNSFSVPVIQSLKNICLLPKMAALKIMLFISDKCKCFTIINGQAGVFDLEEYGMTISFQIK